MLKIGEPTKIYNQSEHRKLPRALSVRREDFNLALLGKVIITFIFLGTILVPIFSLSGIPLLQNIADFGWDFGRAICSYTDQSLEIAGAPLMVCTRCFGVGLGLLTLGMVYFYTSLIKTHLPRRRLHLGVILGLLFVPWLIDSGLERLGLWVTNHLLMLPTGFMGGVAIALAPLLFWPHEE